MSISQEKKNAIKTHWETSTEIQNIVREDGMDALIMEMMNLYRSNRTYYLNMLSEGRLAVTVENWTELKHCLNEKNIPLDRREVSQSVRTAIESQNSEALSKAVFIMIMNELIENRHEPFEVE